MGPHDFSLRELHAALDAERKARGLSWAEVSAEMKVGAATVSGLRTRATVEADGVLQMLRWLGRAPESFIAGASAEDRSRLPGIASNGILRFDTARLHAALDAQRTERGMSWARVAKELGLGAASLTHLARGGRTAFPAVMRMLAWLGRPAAEFMRASDRREEPR
jgi:transcriptional regulator with XRE-family HTH domain